MNEQRLLSASASAAGSKSAHRERVGALDGLRGIAILMVIYQHAYAARLMTWLRHHGYYPLVVGDAWIGVSLFFVLSGLVLTLPFVGRERESLTANGIENFLVRRAKRLLPLFVFVSVIGFALFIPNNLGALLLTISTFHMFVPSQFVPLVNGPFWSLSVEIWASVALPFLILAAGRFGYLRVFVVVVALALCVRLISTLHGLNDAERLAVRDSVPARLDDFTAGMILAWLFANGRLHQSRAWMIILSGLLIIIGCLIIDLVASRPSWRLLQAFEYIPITAGFSLLVAYSLSDANLIRRVLVCWPLQMLGLMCFSLYSWHNIFLSTMPRANLVGELTFWLVTIFVSAATYAYVEFPNLPARKLFKLDLLRMQCSQATLKMRLRFASS
jgi:peptidoglycan/LPS O-acetylase OafA/YrhL